MDIEIYEDHARSGRPAEIISEEMKNKFMEFLSSRRYHITIRSITSWLKRTRTTGCNKSSVKLLNSVGCRRVRVTVKPKLERKHILNRFMYCWERLKEMLDAQTTNKSTVVIDIFVDEK